MSNTHTGAEIDARGGVGVEEDAGRIAGGAPGAAHGAEGPRRLFAATRRACGADRGCERGCALRCVVLNGGTHLGCALGYPFGMECRVLIGAHRCCERGCLRRASSPPLLLLSTLPPPTCLRLYYAMSRNSIQYAAPGIPRMLSALVSATHVCPVLP
eukprot:3241872-Rhodomonas_salina.2